jgi:site-specific recombinase XerD
MSHGYNLYNFEASFKNYLLAGNVKPITIKNYLSDLRHFFGWLIFKLKVKNQELNPALREGREKIENNPINFLNLITPEIIDDYKTYLYENKIPLKTINRRLSTLRKFFSFCINQGWLKENPARKISNIKKNKIEEILNQYKQNLVKENFDTKTINSYLEDIREFLSIIGI